MYDPDSNFVFVFYPPLPKRGNHVIKSGATDWREFWLRFVLDQAGPPSKLPGRATCSLDGCRLTEAGFVGHRRRVEPEHPLELDLLEMGLDVMPECLRVWQRAKVSRLVARWVGMGLKSHDVYWRGCKQGMPVLQTC